MEKLKKVLFTHDDLDGAGCRILFEVSCKRRGYDYTVINSHNNTIDNDVRNYISEHHEPAEFFFADICCSEELLKSIAADMSSSEDGDEMVHVYDHHITNRFADSISGVEACIKPCKEPGGKFESGTSIMYHFSICEPVWFSDRTKQIVNAIRCWDTFEWKDLPSNNLLAIQARQLNSLFHTFGMDTFCNFYEYIIETEKELDIYLRDEAAWIIPNPFIKEMVENQIKAEDEGINNFANAEAPEFKFNIIDEETNMSHTITAAYFVCPGSLNISIAMSKYLELHPLVDVAVMYMPQYNTLSLRTLRDDISVAKICKTCGGGGHPKAAGCPAPSAMNSLACSTIKNYIESHCVTFS